MEKEIGVLCHITSLPSNYGIGDFGKPCFKFINFLVKNKIYLWQILPISNTNEYSYPYGSMSSVTIDEMFADIDDLVKRKLIKKSELKTLKELRDTHKVNYKVVKAEKLRLLDIAYGNLTPACKEELKQFSLNNPHVLNYAYFRTLLDEYKTIDWRNTPKQLWDLDGEKANEFKKEHEEQINKHIFNQYVVTVQWQRVKSYANSKNVKLLGDMPIYLEAKSLDVFVNKQAFKLNKDYSQSITGGVPADEFNADGQDWGTCIYNWNYLQKTNYKYMIEKIKFNLKNFDILRLDHYTGYVKHFEITDHNIKDGVWVDGGGEEFFNLLMKEVKKEQIVVEDLGSLSKECVEVKKQFNFKGMNIYQFAFDGDEKNPHLPQNVTPKTIYFLGTHDNDTFMGYLSGLTKERKVELFGDKADEIILVDSVKEMLGSKAETIVLQMQDFLLQGSEERMNRPGFVEDNWEYRVPRNYKKQFIKTLKQIRY